MQAHVKENISHELVIEQLTQIERKSKMKGIRLLAWALPLVPLFLLQLNQATAQTLPEIAVSENEIAIPGDGSAVLIDDVALSLPLGAGFTECIVTFNTELATSEEAQQLAILFYASGASPDPSTCSLTQVDGPI